MKCFQKRRCQFGVPWAQTCRSTRHLILIAWEWMPQPAPWGVESRIHGLQHAAPRLVAPSCYGPQNKKANASTCVHCICETNNHCGPHPGDHHMSDSYEMSWMISHIACTNMVPQKRRVCSQSNEQHVCITSSAMPCIIPFTRFNTICDKANSAEYGIICMVPETVHSD